MEFQLPPQLTEILGMEPCIFTWWTVVPYALLVMLFCSIFYRQRGIVFHRYYEKHNLTAPTVPFSPIPYESVAAVLISLPRAFSIVNITPADFAIENIRYELTSTTWLHWSLVGYIVALDLYERYQWNRKTLATYHLQKSQQALHTVASITKEALEDSRNLELTEEDIEKGCTHAAVDRSLSIRERIMLAINAPYERQKVTALNIAATYQIMAYAKILCASVFLLNTSTFSCLALRSNESNFGSTLPWFIITLVATLRGLRLMVEGYRFAVRELPSDELSRF